MNKSMDPSILVGDVLEGFAKRGLFKGFSRQTESRRQTRFKILWHREQMFEWTFDHSKKSLRVACAVPQVPAKSPMYRDFKNWLKSKTDGLLPEHRRCDPAKVLIKAYNRGGELALTLNVLDDDFEYGARKLVNLVNEIYLDFLMNGLYFDWLIETFDLDPDNPR